MASSWDSHIANMMVDPTIGDCALCGYGANQYVWAFHPSGLFGAITPEQISKLLVEDDLERQQNGVYLGTRKCTFLRNNFWEEGRWTMDLMSKSTETEPSTNICLGRANTVIVVRMLKHGQSPANLNKDTEERVRYLRQSGF